MQRRNRNNQLLSQNISPSTNNHLLKNMQKMQSNNAKRDKSMEASANVDLAHVGMTNKPIIQKKQLPHLKASHGGGNFLPNIKSRNKNVQNYT